MMYDFLVAITKKRVLVVDDEPGVLRFVRVSLSVAGYEVTTTTSGEEALELAESARPDIMLVDLVMSPLSGFDVLARLRPACKVPVIVFSARTDMSARAVEAGASDFISKPFQPAQLIRLVQEVLSKG